MEKSGSPCKSEAAAAAVDMWRPAVCTAYTLLRASIAVAVAILKATVVTVIAGSICFSPLMVTVLLASFFGQLLMDELIQSLTRPATGFKQVTAVKAQSKTGTVLAMVQASICSVFDMVQTGTLTVLDVFSVSAMVPLLVDLLYQLLVLLVSLLIDAMLIQVLTENSDYVILTNNQCQQPW